MFYTQPTPEPLPVSTSRTKAVMIVSGLLLATVAALAFRSGSKQNEDEQTGNEPTKAQDLAQAEKKRLMAEMGRKGGKKSAEARRQQKTANEAPADELQS